MSEDNTTKPQSSTEPPHRIWIRTRYMSGPIMGGGIYHTDLPDGIGEEVIEYVRADLVSANREAPTVDKNSAARSCEIFAEMIESENDLSGQTENWSDFHRGQHCAAKQLANAFRRAAAPLAAKTLDAGIEEAWPLVDVLRKLAFAAEHLGEQHDCDHHRYEEIIAAKDAAYKYLAAKEEED